MKKYFFTGLVIILPFFLTIYIIWIVFKIVGTFFTPAITKIFESNVAIKIPSFAIVLISAVATLFLIWLIGILASNFIGKQLIQWAENLLLKIPMARGIYDAINKFIKVFFMGTTNFKRVVLVEWPRRGIYSIAFITSESVGEVQVKTKEEVVNIFLPSTPNPTTGFFVLIPKQDIIPLEMSVDDAIKLIISGGIVTPPYKTKNG
ncbi:MAG: hypothetical protein A2474_00080 [Elusimicrobia bacterium RIFOXYC2_FULL_34_12]|nr:MAG: hypothetical protein A2474_00080 [Elusimicrobia bacterium RIFOXYC2_FULL_34_12]OGS38382.1 MAG: hypothetical protein A2551_07085 [Elusimicrobia bacterium RIFOXYD2_FULL_34_30]